MNDLEILKQSLREAREGVHRMLDELGKEHIFGVLKSFSEKSNTPDEAVIILCAAYGYSMALLDHDKEPKLIEPSKN